MKHDIPQVMRELTVKNIDQAHVACIKLLGAARQARDLMKPLFASNSMMQGLGEAQERALKFTEQNLDASFALENDLARARYLKEALQIQSRHAQLQMHTIALQAQEFTGMLVRQAPAGLLPLVIISQLC